MLHVIKLFYIFLLLWFILFIYITDTFDKNEELIEEWLEEDVTEDINTEAVTKDEDGMERDKDGTNDDEYDTEEDVVLNVCNN